MPEKECVNTKDLVLRLQSRWTKWWDTHEIDLGIFFKGLDAELADYFASMGKVAVSPDKARWLCWALNSLPIELRLNFVFPFLIANLSDLSEADVSADICAGVIATSSAEQLTDAYTAADLKLLIDYFKMIARLRDEPLGIESRGISALLLAASVYPKNSIDQ